MEMRLEMMEGSIVFAALNAGHAKKRVINLRGVWANSNQSVQILESISQHPASARHASTPNQLPPSADTTIARADNRNSNLCYYLVRPSIFLVE